MIQIDMPMPTNCLDCPACNEYLMCSIPVNGRKWGENDVHEFDKSRPQWCPMKEQQPKTGHWKHTGRKNVYGGIEIVCSVCDNHVMVQNLDDELFCRHCGAKMENPFGT